MSAPSNSLNRQKSQKPSTLDSVNDLASLISLAYLSTKTARESQPCTVYLSRSVRLMFVPDVTVVGESIHHTGPYGGRKQTPVAYPNTCSESFWQNSQNKKQGCVKSVLSVMHSRSQPAVSLMIICIHTEICSTKEFIGRRNSLVIHTTVPQSVFIIYYSSALGLFKAQHVIQSF